ncbi:hypothetical protein BV25DRAFT_1831115 [Artomyces pyxidatus]|uniref:Uncharacterized protein n=1 Tax=Artomyces pyxidatus TaxID=48021 RepID=A0ACB8SLN9_9AGAM|nr:hypothetical protein BV25DRAFT_1831115 [Artomyces pyxidatus]
MAEHSVPETLSSPVEVRDADPPFDGDDADIILRSCDNVDFHVHKLFLSRASPFFKAMLSLPTPAHTHGVQPGTSDEVRNGLPVVRMSEDTHILDAALRLCYPPPLPRFDTLETLKAAWRAAAKFDIRGAHEVCAQYLLMFAKQEPERVYALAWTYGAWDVAAIAARETLQQPLLVGPYVEEFNDISGAALFRLLEYQRRCIQAVETLIPDLKTWLDLADIPKPIDARCPAQCPTRETRTRDASPVDVKVWWWTYLSDVVGALKKNPLDLAAASGHLTLVAIERAAACPGCRELSITRAMERFNRRLAVEVESRISHIQLTVP